MNDSPNYRRIVLRLAEEALRGFGGVECTRESAAQLVEVWPGRVLLSDELRTEVLSRFSPAEPPAVPGLDFLPAVVETAERDGKQIVAEVFADEHDRFGTRRGWVMVAEPEPEPLTGEVTSPFGPCSGLAADKRDNTCTNFAAEYVSYQAEHWSGMTCRRLCTSCADAAPDVYSRKPLTHGPGGVPVERAS